MSSCSSRSSISAGPVRPCRYPSAAAPDDRQLDIVFLFENDRAPCRHGSRIRKIEPPPVTVRQGRKVELKWKHGHARIDDRVYVPPKVASHGQDRAGEGELARAGAGVERIRTRIRLRAPDRAGRKLLERCLIGVVETERRHGDEIRPHRPEVAAVRRLGAAALDTHPVIGAPARIGAILDAQQPRIALNLARWRPSP